MAEITINQQDFDKYSTKNKLRLSSGYTQRVFENNGYPGYDGIVQILKSKPDKGETEGKKYIHRLRFSDGVFYYSCFVSPIISEQVENELDHLKEGTIIALTDFELFPGESKPIFILKGYKLLSRYHPTLSDDNGKIVAHTGQKETHLNYHPSIILEDEWPEASNFITKTEENEPPIEKKEINVGTPKAEHGPPPAKHAKMDNGTAVRARAAPPPPSRKGSNKLGDSGIIEISRLSPYNGHLKIHGMVTRKEELKTIPVKNTKILNFELTDAAGDSIRITAFNELAESVNSIVAENMSYYVSNGSVRPANKRFNNTGCEYEITLRNESKIEPGTEIFSTPKLVIKRVELNKIASHIGALIDVMGVVERMDENFTEFTSRQGKQFVKREMDIIDESAVQVRVTLWGDEAKNANTDIVGKVVVLKGVSPREFNGSYSLSTGVSTRIYNTPEMEQVAKLFDWYENSRPNADIKMLSQLTSYGSSEVPRTIAGIIEMRFGENSEKGDYATIKAMVTRINTNNILYKGCSNAGCQKKVIDNDGTYRCEKCSDSKSDFKWLYMMQLELSDATGQVYVTAFGDTAAKIVGKPANEVGELMETDPEKYNEIFENIQFKSKLWRVRCKMETYNEEVKQRLTVFSVDEVNQDKYLGYLEELVKQLESLPSN